MCLLLIHNCLVNNSQRWVSAWRSEAAYTSSDMLLSHHIGGRGRWQYCSCHEVKLALRRDNYIGLNCEGFIQPVIRRDWEGLCPGEVVSDRHAVLTYTLTCFLIRGKSSTARHVDLRFLQIYSFATSDHRVLLLRVRRYTCSCCVQLVTVIGLHGRTIERRNRKLAVWHWK